MTTRTVSLRVLPLVVVVCAVGCSNPNETAPSPSVKMPPVYYSGYDPAGAPMPGNGNGPAEPWMSGPKGVLIATLRNRVTEEPIAGARIRIDHNDWGYETNSLGFVHIRVLTDRPIQMAIDAPGYYFLQIEHPPVGNGDGSPTCGPTCGGAWPGPKVGTVFYLSSQNAK